MPVAQPLLHRLAFPPEQLPSVDPSNLAKAWRAATIGAETGLVLQLGDIEGVEFRWDSGESIFLFADLDASCWAAAIDRLYGLDNTLGVTTLFRLLALIELVARADWLQPLFRLGHRDGPLLDPEVLHLAATQPLTASARFEATEFRRRLGDKVEQTRAIPTRLRRLGKL
jgi:hypothetical protein